MPSHNRAGRRRLNAVVALAAVLCVGRRATRIQENGSDAASTGAVGALSGIVLDRATGRGVMGATVHLAPDAPDNTVAAPTSAMTVNDGSFVIARVLPGSYSLEVNARGYQSNTGSVRFSPGQTRRGYTIRLTTASACPAVIVGRKNPACPLTKRDTEYTRCGTANLFAVVEPKAGHHFTRATPDRSGRQFAWAIRDLVAAYPATRTIHLMRSHVQMCKWTPLSG